MEASRNYNSGSFVDINNLFNNQEEENLYRENDLFKINSEYKGKSNSIEEDAKEPIRLTIKIGEKEIPITRFNCAKLENVTEKNLIEIANKIKYLPTPKQKHDLTKRIKCATKQLKNAENIPTIRVDTEEFHITCIGYGEYTNLTEKQLKSIEKQMDVLPFAAKQNLCKKILNARETKKSKKIPKIKIKIGEKKIPITRFNCAKLENVTKENLIEIENKIKDLSTRKQKYDLTTKINCAKKQLENAEKIPTIRVDAEEFHITCLGLGEYKNLSEEELKIIENRMSVLPLKERNKLFSKLFAAKKTKEPRIAQDKQNQSSDDDFKNKSIQIQDFLLEKNKEQEEKSKPIEDVNNWIQAEIEDVIPHFFDSDISIFFDSDRENLISNKEYVDKSSNKLELDTNTITVTKEKNHQENQQTRVSNTENTSNSLKSKKRRLDAM